MERWQGHRNILAWETVTEINLINGITQADGVYLLRDGWQRPSEKPIRRNVP